MCTNIKSGFQHINKIAAYQQFKQNGNTHEQNRKSIRDSIVDLFKQEKAGTGNGINSTRIIYCVEQINNEIVYLKRPTSLNKGFDFEIHTKNYQFSGRIKSRPSHQDIFSLLRTVKQTNLNFFNQIQNAIDEIYFCNDSVIANVNGQLGNQLDIKTFLYLIKWLFIEQDITYWSFSGREMFYVGLKNV